MGCDMEITVQTRVPRAQWRTQSAGRVGLGVNAEPDPRERCYALYARLAGSNRASVAHIEPLFADRGVPSDLLESRDLDLDDIGDHHLTWATLAELRAAPWAMEELEDTAFLRWLRGPELSALAAEFGDDAVRLLFGFNG